MFRNRPTIIIDPTVLFREGLRRVVSEADFHVFWCSDHAPAGPIQVLSDRSTPLVIIGGEIDQAIIQVAEVKRHYPTARVVLLMELGSRQQLLTAFRSGVDTLLRRDSSYEAFIHTLELVLDGATVLPSDLIDLLLMVPEEPAPSALAVPAGRVSSDVAICEILPLNGLPPLNGLLRNVLSLDNPPQSDQPRNELPQDAEPHQSFGLSLRELGVLEQLQEGKSNKEIARDLGITEATVKVHVKAVLRKARLRNRTQVAMWASKLGVGQPQQIAGL